MTRKILLTGPESSGKTTLTKQLAQHFGSSWRQEYARTYLSQLDRAYTRADLTLILQEQQKQQTQLPSKPTPLLFCDTGPEVLYIWSKVKYGQVATEIEQQLSNDYYDLRLLCYPDLNWEADPLREAPKQQDRLSLWQEYLKLHKQQGWDYQIIKGKGYERLKTALQAIENQQWTME